MKIFISIMLFLASFYFFINHRTVPLPEINQSDKTGPAGVYIERSDNSHRHLILSGGDFKRGQESGRLVNHLLLKQEDLLVSKLDEFIGNDFVQNLFFTGARVWFHDQDKYIDPASMKEMAGVGTFAPKQYEYLGDGFTRQIAYHGLHEVGQMFVDEEKIDLGCFGILLKTKNNNWVIGRNFDFDVDGLFDREKLLKWVFPTDGIPYLSIIWAGMVGGVTGVNAKGIYGAINSAGSEDFKRVGAPTTIVLKNVLAKANTLEEAIKIVEESPVFITEIFTLADARTKRVAVVEKSPAKFATRIVQESDVVSNHLISPIWGNDKTNHYRRDELTSNYRYLRGQELLKQADLNDPIAATVKMLRDKSLPQGKKGHVGHRGSIDSFIASQSLVLDLEKEELYLNLGPGTTGKYVGYDLKQSFAEKRPVLTHELPADNISVAEYDSFQQQMNLTRRGLNLLSKNNCEETRSIIPKISSDSFIHYDKERLLGDYAEKCLKDPKLAQKHWQASMDFNPAFAKIRNYLEDKIK